MHIYVKVYKYVFDPYKCIFILCIHIFGDFITVCIMIVDIVLPDL